MQGTRKVSHMKGRSNKLVDLPTGAKPQRTLRKRQTVNAVSEAITTQQSETILNTKKVNPMAMTIKQAIARAIKSEVTVMPEGMEAHRDIVKKIHADPAEFLIRHYPAVDSDTITEFDKAELDIAELVAKHNAGKGENVVGEWLEIYGLSPKERDETLQKAIEFIDEKMNDSKTIFETVESENTHARRRQVAVLSSIATTALVGGAKMLMNDDFGKGEILKTVAGAAISGTVTTVTMNALSDKELGSMESAGIGAGIGLVIGGSLTFGLDMFCAGEGESGESAPAELPAPAVL